MLDSGLDGLGTRIDFVVIVASISLLAYALFRGYLKGPTVPSKGVSLIVAGMFLAMVAHLFDPILYLAEPAGAGPFDSSVAVPVVSDHFQSDLFHWVLSRLAFGLIAVGLLVAILNRKRLQKNLDDVLTLAEDAKKKGMLQESRLRYLFANTTDSVFCLRFDPPLPTNLPVDEQVRRSYDAYLEDCNVVFAREFETDDPSEVVGMLVGDMDSAKDEAAHYAYISTFVENDYSLSNYDMNYKSPDGGDRALCINMVGDVHDGYLHRIWAVEQNVLEMRLTRARLERRKQFQKLVADLSSRLVKVADDDADDEVSACLCEVCRYVGAERSFMFRLNPATRQAEVTHFCSPLGNPFGKTIPLATAPNFWGSLMEGNSIRINDVTKLPDDLGPDKASLEGYGVKSLLVLPMIEEGDVVGGITMGRVLEQRDWSDDDFEEVRVVAELFTSFVMRLRSRRALDEALSKLQKATDRLEAENVYLREEIKVSHGFDSIIGNSKAVLRSLRQVEQVAPTKATALVLGETGTGKELIARAIHELSDRKDHPLVKVNCAALPPNLVESELFGYEKGAFTGADGRKRGRFDLANGSTLFLDEIGEIPIELQAKLLRVLQEGEFERLGGTATVKVDVRVIVATNRDLEEAVADGTFRSDLYYRINSFPISIPPLRERGDDIQILAEHFVKLHSQRLGRDITEISAEMMRQLRHYRWPGNVRELEGIVQRAVISSQGPVLELAAPLLAEADEPQVIETSITGLKVVERDHILSVLEESKWKISGKSGAAARLGIPPSTLRSKMRKLSIDRPR